MNIAILSGGFDPVHPGHIALFKEANRLYDFVTVALNDDNWLCKKKGTFLMPLKARRAVLESIRWVDLVEPFPCDEAGSAVNGLQAIIEMLGGRHKYFLLKSGDRTPENIPKLERDFCARWDVEVVRVEPPDLGYSSSKLLMAYANNSRIVHRPWGYYTQHERGQNYLCKTLVVEPGHSISLQAHHHRDEFWIILSGDPTITAPIISNTPVRYAYVPRGEKHRIENLSNDLAIILEIQFGDCLTEFDIERFSDQYGRV